MRIKYIIITLLAIVALEANASKAVPVPMQVTLQDGTTLEVTLRGDEHVSYFLAGDGTIVLEDNNTFRRATQKEIDDIRAAEEETYEQNMSSLAKLMGAFDETNSAEVISGTRCFPHMGKPRVPVILVDFTDRSFTFTDHAAYDEIFNSPVTSIKSFKGYGSVAEYFNFCSNGQFRPQFDFYGPYHLSNNIKFYGEGNDRMDRLIPEACNLADADVDFSQYDSDNDGYVDLVYVLYAGYGANWGQNGTDCIWPKSGVLTTIGSHDGKNFYRYGVTNELLAYPGAVTDDKGNDRKILSGVGVFCHEMSHTLGLPDFYPPAGWSPMTLYNNQSMEEWDLMDGGENVSNGFYPTPYTAWERELMGWTDRMPVLENSMDVVGLIPLTKNGTGYRVKNDADKTGNEFYILENIPLETDGWYRKMPKNGMIVTHINYDKGSFANFTYPNGTKGKPRITILPADGSIISSYNISGTALTTEEQGDPYPGSKGVTTLTNWKNYVGAPMDKPITDIAIDANGIVTFKFMYGESKIPGDLNNDGRVTMHDANMVANFSNGTVASLPNRKMADVNNDGIVDMQDAKGITDLYLGKGK